MVYLWLTLTPRPTIRLTQHASAHCEPETFRRACGNDASAETRTECKELNSALADLFFVIRYETKTTARWALTFIVRIFVNDTIAMTVWASFCFHVAPVLLALCSNWRVSLGWGLAEMPSKNG